MNKRINVKDRFGREVLDEDEDGRIVVPDGGVCHVDMQFLDARNGRYIVDKSRQAYERYCDRLSTANAARQVRDGKPNPWRFYTDWLIAHGNL